MADHQRIHPVDVESQKPSAPLISRESSRSHKGDPSAAAFHPLPSPPIRRTLPVSHSRPPKSATRRRCSCCRCLCWTLLSLVLLLILLAAALAALYFVFDPKLPKYSVDRLRVSNFSADANLTVRASFDVTVTAENPNKGIGIYYEKNSKLSVWYSDYSLCEGTLPAFYQGHRNTTVLIVVMAGEGQIGSDKMTALQNQQQTGSVPLEFKADVPVKVKLGGLKLWKVNTRVRCSLVVDSLTANNQIKIKSSSCKFRLKL